MADGSVATPSGAPSGADPRGQSRPLVIFAGNARQAEDYARENRLSRDAWRYAGSLHHFLGLRGGTFVVVGTFYERNDCADLLVWARAADFVQVAR